MMSFLVYVLHVMSCDIQCVFLGFCFTLDRYTTPSTKRAARCAGAVWLNIALRRKKNVDREDVCPCYVLSILYLDNVSAFGFVGFILFDYFLMVQPTMYFLDPITIIWTQLWQPWSFHEFSWFFHGYVAPQQKVLVRYSNSASKHSMDVNMGKHGQATLLHQFMISLTQMSVGSQGFIKAKVSWKLLQFLG